MSHFVYVIGTRLPGGRLGAPSKIGITANPVGRLSTIRTSCPAEIDFAHVFQVRLKEAAADIERKFHTTFANRSLAGEWFDINPWDAVEEMALDFEFYIIAKAPEHNIGAADFIREKSEWCGVWEAKKKLAAEYYIEAWLDEAA